MSGFDFDRLRDHLAPVPGRRERDDVDARARRLRARTRRNRLALSSISVVAVAAIVLGIVASQRNKGPEIVVGGGLPSTTLATGPTITAPPTTAPAATQTTAAAATPSPALSATWVSPDHGWLLQQDGSVAETTDGGTSWHFVGSVRFPEQSEPRIRFGDSTHGYVFSPSGETFATQDGGQSWHALALPFEGTADLVITNGTVYAASYDTKTPFVDVWSASIGASNWTKHPTGVPIGAGPVPQTQLVFSGGAGWLLEVDRTVVGGAELTPAGQWAKWTPPCATANGPASLAASSASDLVASCEEHTYGGGPVESSIWFSHDGGQTFSRHSAPTSGSVTTPKGSKAVVVGSGGIQHTTDEGATWHENFVAGLRSDDLGFTTSTQGFIILSNGEMLMTRDAGVTWQEVTLP